ncbi:hypothetical protein CC1G_14717 [Coprinopsis cinerea okayama7|uniref:Ras-GAP domain-containing protein n=1 Tax=Coprinopsis cinerea (strain Okayama-7 / 130 / ATCC MYA-4618 / FGSC 9003) TaxID=240176 RepID=D6RN06_COPC7|nr:hypothetical protein CC1G_14717 [Coprinopsis cinerea okayama7\|eukprot:XP_002911288.1 hypothetical protein CC1G_14717 [Coprinopsis cinerea okayama7\
MPTRRPSASAGQPGNTYSSASGRSHKSSDSYHGHPGAGASTSSGHPPQANPGNPQQPVVAALVKRLGGKRDLHQQPENPTIQVLQSQLFVLKVLSLAMASRWHPDPSASRSMDARSSESSTMVDSPQTTGSRAAPSIRSTWTEPTPMDDSCAKYLLSVMVLFLRQTMTYDVPLMLATNSTDLSFRDYELHDTMNITMTPEMEAVLEAAAAAAGGGGDNGEPSLRSQRSAMSVKSGKMSISSTLYSTVAPRAYEKTHLSLLQNPAAVNNLIAKATGRVIFHLSVMNWPVVYHRLRAKIRFLGGTADDPDHVDLQLMAYSNLDRPLLVSILNDVSSLLVNMGRDAQVAIAISLRTALWNWIERYPGQFNEVIRTRGKTEGAPERVFDLLYPSAHGNERILWPCLILLNCMSYDRIQADVQSSQYGTPKRKEQRFGQELVRHLHSNSKLSEVALACAVDFCRVAAFVEGNDEVPILLIASDLAHEIKGALWNSMSRKAFWETFDEIDVALYADALVAIFRFLPEEDSIPIFCVCIEPERSEAVKTCVIRACLTLNQDAARIKMQKPLDRLQDAIAHRCRAVLTSTAVRRPELDQYGNVKRISSRPKGKRTPSETLSDKEILLLSILSIWRQSPMFFMKGITEAEMETWITMTVKLWDAQMDTTVKVSTASCLRKVTELSFLVPPTDKAGELTVESLKRSLPITLQSVCHNLLNSRADADAHHLWVSLAHSIVDIYSKRIDMEHVRAIQLDERRTPALTLAEIALMVSLTASDVNISHLAAKSLRLLAQVEQRPNAPSSPILGEEEFSKRNFVYEQIGDPRVMVVGRVGYQKRLRKLIRLISYSSPIHSAVWAECYGRWRSISQPVYEALNEELNGNTSLRSAFGGQHQEFRFQWQNLTLFLATLCGTCTSEKPDMTTLINTIPSEFMPDKIRVFQHIPALAETFISDLISLLMHHDAFIRDTAREALGSELSPRFYPKLIRFMDEQMRSIEQGAGPKLKEDYILFLDQFIAVLKLLADSQHGPQEDTITIDISSLMLSIAEFIARYEEPASHRIKIKFCVLAKSICDNSEILTIRKDNQIRNNILDIVLDWLQPLAIMPNGYMEHDMAQSELNMACLRTAVKLLDRLQLQTTEVTNSADETLHVVSGLFKRYADRLLQCLDKYRFDVPTSDSTSELGSVHQRMKTSQKEAELRDLVITGLTHLVSSNSESGFKQCLHLAYDSDPRKRTIFAHVFARVLGEGTIFEPPEKVPPPNKSARFSDLLRGSDMVLAMTICEICPPSEVDMIISCLLNVFDSRRSLMALMKLIIEREVSQTDSEAALFRSNSTCTRLLSQFARIHGYAYLRSIIAPLIRTLVSAPEGEVAGGGPNVEFLASMFINIVISSKNIVPPMIREVCAHIGKTVAELWPDSRFAALGAFIFLRFISPVIVSPEAIDIELPKDKDDPLTRRGLMGVARFVQNLANHALWSKGGEVQASQKDPTTRENLAKITDFLENLQEIPASQSEDNDVWHGLTPDDTDIIVLHRFFDKHADKIGKELLSLSKPSSEGDISAINGKRAWDGLCALLVDLGTPLEVPRPSLANSTEHHEYLDLMAECNGRSTTRVRDLFVETELGDDDAAYFVFRFSKVDVEDLDIQLLMYHIFKTATSEPYLDRPFDVIIDCTAFSSISELPLQWLKFCAEVVPADIRARFRTAHVLNPNHLAHKYLRRLYNVSAGTPYCNDIRAYVSVEQLLDSGVPPEVLPALEYPVTIEQEPVEGFFPSITFKKEHMRTSVDLQVTSRHIKFTTAKASAISPGFASRYVEIIPLSEVLDTYNILTGEPTQNNEFIIRRRHQHLYFFSTERDTIVKTIRSAKGKLKEIQSPLTERFSRFSNIPATLLHIGFLSVDPNDEELRGAAYNLLGAICTYLKYDKSPIVARNAGFIPGDPFTFVNHLSEKLAEFAPRLTLDFIHEVSAAMSSMDQSAVAQRINCLHYMSPWIRNLSMFVNPTSPLYEKSGTRFRDCVRTLADLSLTYPETSSTLQKFVWAEMAKLETYATDTILDELVRAAIDGGIGTRRCEIVAQIIATLSSISVRSRLYSRLRRALGKPAGASKKSNLPPNSLTKHFNWNEIATLVRLVSALGTMQPKQAGITQLFVPELCHLVTLTAAEGPSLVRKSVYGTVVNLLQGLYISRSEELSGPELMQLMETCTTPATLKMFGLARDTPTSEYTSWDPSSDREQLDQLEGLVNLMLRITEVTSGSRGLLNIWRARWMGLVTAAAFQVSPVVQTRAFVVLGALANADVDDDFVYQILVALKTAFSKPPDVNNTAIVSMLRCLCKIIPVLQHGSRYLHMFFWLAVALLQSSHPSYYNEAANLLTISLDALEERGYFRRGSMTHFLLEMRAQLEDQQDLLDDLSFISFEQHFSISLAHVIFKGMRHAFSRDAAEKALRRLLTISAKTHNQFNDRAFNGYSSVLCPDVLGYFLALLPVSTTAASYRRLLKESLVDDAWHQDAGLPDVENDDTSAPRVTPPFLGINDSATALLVAMFAAVAITTAQGDDAETEMWYGLLSDLATSFPDVMALIYDSLKDKFQLTFASSSNPNAIRSATNIFRVWSSLQPEGLRYENKPRGSSASTLEKQEERFFASRDLLIALEELNMVGLAYNHNFLPPGHIGSARVIHWINNLVAIIS